VKERVTNLAAAIDRLSLRERIFVLAAVIVVLGGLWEALLAAPLDARERAAVAKIAELQSRLEALNQSIVTTADNLSEGMPNQLDRVRALRARVAEADAAVRVYTTDLVDPGEMRTVLEDLLHRQTQLRLVSAENLPVRPLFDDQAGAAAAPVAAGERQDASAAPPVGIPAAEATAARAPKLYRHTLVLRLQGSYLDCVAYLESIERLPWHLYWTRLELDVGEYPRNDIVLELQTLSLEQGWIGV
jgi:MSHA biogenesis protein MshJ